MTMINGTVGMTSTMSTSRMMTASNIPPHQPASEPAAVASSMVAPPPSAAIDSEVRAPASHWLTRSWPAELVPSQCLHPGGCRGAPAMAIGR